MPNNYHLHYVLNKLISQDMFDLYRPDTPKVVGGFILRQSFTEEELYKIPGFGFHLLMPSPAQKGIKGIKCAEQK